MIAPSIALLFLVQGAFAIRLEADFPRFHLPFNSHAPPPELLETGFTYSQPVGSGCDKNYAPPEFVMDQRQMTINRQTPAISWLRKRPDGTTAWNGFCMMPWTACPDAVANRDYYYYAKSLGKEWVDMMGKADKDYCNAAGFLEPEIALITRNFTALEAKGEELCANKFSDPRFRLTTLKLFDGVTEGAKVSAMNKKAKEQDVYAGKMSREEYNKLPIFDEAGAGISAAWNCALGSVSCDLAYCNYNYCKKPDGSVGVREECEGWDPVHGLPGTWPGGRKPSAM